MCSVNPRRPGFTLIELIIVVAIIAIIAAVAIPSLLNARMAGNESSAISSLRAFVTCQQQYRTRFGSYAVLLEQLQNAGFVDGFEWLPGSGNLKKAGYLFTYGGGGGGGGGAPTTTASWEIHADPLEPLTTGSRYFLVDESGVIRWSSTGPCTTSDPPLD
jgi:prepilin-type N-terminal cleavage/methylation domain-containing protein